MKNQALDSARFTNWIALGAALVTAAILVGLYLNVEDAADPLYVRIVWLILVVGWLDAPYAGLVLLSRKFAAHRGASRGLLMASIVVTVLAVIVALTLSSARTDGQGIILMLALPIFQWVVIGISVAVTRVAEQVHRS
jgi:hypothetical protein